VPGGGYERFHPADGGRDDGQTVGPAALEKFLIDVIKCSRHRHIPGRGFGVGGRRVVGRNAGQPDYHLIHGLGQQV